MKVLIATDLLLAYLVKDDFIIGIDILFQWLRLIRASWYVDSSSIAVLTHFVSTTTLDLLKGYNLLSFIPPKRDVIKNFEKSFASEKDMPLLAQLNILLSGHVDIIITENARMFSIAQILGVDDKVYSIEDFLEKCSIENRKIDPAKGLIVKEDVLGNFSLKDPFFDSFIKEYSPYYKEWFIRKANDKVFVSVDNKGLLYALLKLKVEYTDENYDDINPHFLPAKRLKISSFKVDYTGSKLAERFMRIIFDNALKNEVEEIYVTIFNSSTSRRRLMELLAKWGFEYFGRKKRREYVFVRNFRKVLTGDIQRDFPYHRFEHSAFIVPIYREYASELLPSTDLLDNKDDYEPYRCAIRKVLVLRQDHSSLRPGSIFLFYKKTSTEHHRGIFAVGVVERVYRNFDSEKCFISRCRKRSVLDNERLSSCWTNASQQPVVVDFLYCYSFNEQVIPESVLQQNDVNTDLLQSQHLIEISSAQYNSIIKGTEYESSIVVH